MKYIFCRFNILYILVFFLTSCASNGEYLNHDLQDKMALRRVTKDDSGQKIFTVTYEDLKPKNSRDYTYFSANTVVTTQGDYTGTLLDGTYTHTDFNKRLVEKGDFNKGLKTGDWKTWHPNGKIKSLTKYNNSGVKSGKYFSFNLEGVLVETGNYKRDNKTGEWIINSDTLFFRNGLNITAEKKSKISLFKKLFPQKVKTKETGRNLPKDKFFKRTWDKLFKKNSKKKSFKKSRKNNA